MAVEVKICGITDLAALNAAVTNGARLVGFVFFPASPRALKPAAAAALAAAVPPGVLRVGLVVDAPDAEIEAILAEVPLDLLQLHGEERPDRAVAVRSRFGIPVIKAIAVADAGDVDGAARSYDGLADRLLFDARPPPGASRPGGNARAFDWRVLAGRAWQQPWLLAGGLTADNVAEAVRLSGAGAVDVSSGVEEALGRKSPALIRAFLAKVAQIGAATGDTSDAHGSAAAHI
jgi:phosphoribosylanthranilate isomerase